MLVRDAVRPWVAKLLGHGAGLTLDTHVRVIDELDDAPGSRLSSDLPGALSFDHGRRRASDCGRVIQMSSMRSSRHRGRWSESSRRADTHGCITIFVVDDMINGEPVTEEQIRAWQQQAREGLDVEGLSRRGRPRLGKAGESPVIPVRMDTELLEALTKRAEHDGVSRSQAIRDAVRAWTHAA